MSSSFAQKMVVITGGAKGIGAAAARLFHEQGAIVYILDIDPAGQETAQRIGANCRFMPGDVTNAEQVRVLMETIAGPTGQIDVLVNNAGIQTHGTVADTSEAIWDKTLAVNLTGYFRCAKYAMPHLLKANTPVIINVASVNGIHSEANACAYVTTKAAILGLTNSIAVDFAPKLRCVAVCPGAVNTPMLQADLDAATDRHKVEQALNQIHLLNRPAEADEVAQVILFLASEAASFITGHHFRVDGGIGVRI